ncbi:hypothetical protein XELAEV_18023033mg [Xenopus laevis]|uniref:Secreted protein n=1 Tax=Xenopus laevis TaxID=8355 RepID=A0A974HNQ6_XENLA|nr:hypothetical protein XELAEV_18023033mg [Xenopus laevis]
MQPFLHLICFIFQASTFCCPLQFLLSGANGAILTPFLQSIAISHNPNSVPIHVPFSLTMCSSPSSPLCHAHYLLYISPTP